MSVHKVTDQEFQQQLNANDKVVVKYFADWCGNCRLIAPRYARMSEDPSHAGVVFLEVNAEENPLARQAAGVSNLPFFATFSAGQLKAGMDTSRPETVEQLIRELEG